ncbi:MAG: glycosyltransferase family 2 protein [Clostridia bacterium]|nr:glycosyltransferase family 2 protein [Clostridia bacterium]
MLKTLIIIPAYNEQDAIKQVIENIKLNIDNTNTNICVINDGSTDNTLNILSKIKDIIVLDLIQNLGIGGAVQAGYVYAFKNDYDIAIQIDGDGQHNPIYIKDMIKKLDEEQLDMLIGSRFCEKTKYRQTFMRMFGINIISFMIKLLSGNRIYDPTSGYRVVNKEVIQLFAKSYPYDYPEPSTNLQLKLMKKNILEVPVEMNLRETGKSSIHFLKSASYMVKVCLTLIIMKFRKLV